MSGEISGYKGDFYKDLAEWSHGFIKGMERQRMLQEDYTRKVQSIAWMEVEVKRLESRLARKPSVSKQIQHYRHDIRRLEIEIAFLTTEEIQ